MKSALRSSNHERESRLLNPHLRRNASSSISSPSHSHATSRCMRANTVHISRVSARTSLTGMSCRAMHRKDAANAARQETVHVLQCTIAYRSSKSIASASSTVNTHENVVASTDANAASMRANRLAARARGSVTMHARMHILVVVLFSYVRKMHLN